MIIDAHTYVWQSPQQLGPHVTRRLNRTAEPWQRPDASLDSHTAAMQPVTMSFVLGVVSPLAQAAIGMDYIAQVVRHAPDRCVGFAGVDPMTESPEPLLARACDLGLVGIHISPAGQGFHPTHTRAMAWYEKCQALGVPIIISPGVDWHPQSQMEYARPELLDEVARTFPTLHLVIAQLGYPWIDSTLTLLGKHQHVYASLARIVGRPWALYQALLAAYELDVCDKLLFASGFPWCSPEQAILNIYGINHFSKGSQLPNVPRRFLRSIVEADALNRLGIQPPVNLPATVVPADDEPTDQAVAHSHAAGDEHGARP